MDAARRVFMLQVVSADALRGFVVLPGAGGQPAFQGGGSIDFICGTCLERLASGVSPGMFDDLVFQCRCGSWNRAGAQRSLR